MDCFLVVIREFVRFKYLGKMSFEPITIYCDNVDAIHIVFNSDSNERTSHIEVDCHSIRKKVQVSDHPTIVCYKSLDQTI